MGHRYLNIINSWCTFLETAINESAHAVVHLNVGKHRDKEVHHTSEISKQWNNVEANGWRSNFWESKDGKN